MKTVLGFSRRAQPDQRWVERHFVAEGDLVVVYGRREGTWQASSFRGVNTPAGLGVPVELAHMFRRRDGKVTEHWAVRDDLGMMQQLRPGSAGASVLPGFRGSPCGGTAGTTRWR